MSSTPEVVIYGASGHSSAIAYALTYGFSPYAICKVVAFIDDYVGSSGRNLKGIPVLSFEEWQHDYIDKLCFVSVGNTAAKRKLVARLLAAGGKFDCFYKDSLLPFEDVLVGAGTVVAPPLYIGSNTVIGDHVQILPMCSIGHDVVVQDFATISPSCTISGHVIVEEGVFLGAGTVVVNGSARRPLVVGKDAKSSAGSVITKAIPAGAKIAGNPARSLRKLIRELSTRPVGVL